MAQFLTFDAIRNSNSSDFSRKIVENAERRAVNGSTFLSYSSRDDEFLPSIIGVLKPWSFLSI